MKENLVTIKGTQENLQPTAHGTVRCGTAVLRSEMKRGARLTRLLSGCAGCLLGSLDG